jgi:DNA-binding MarR family transcriptional regulator
MSTSREELEEQTWRALRALVLDRYDRRPLVAEQLGMSFLRAKALWALADGSLTMRELATELGTDAPYTTVIVDDLEERGLVLRTQLPEDRRMKAVAVTRSGRRVARRADKILNEAPEPMGTLPAKDLAALHRIASALLAEE